MREIWSEKINKSKIIKVNFDAGGNMLFARLFGLADLYRNGNLDAINEIENIIEVYVE